jgi:lysophospholipid acyltransferase (LPLAT)-like uncharacterized protein
MKIRNPAIIKWIGFLGAALIHWWVGTLSIRLRTVNGQPLFPVQAGFNEGSCLYAFWHENILAPCGYFGRRDIHVLIGEHADGEMIAQIAGRLGFGLIRGSSTRGGIKAMRQMIRASAGNHIVVMPDGPRGPRRHIEPGLLYLASRTGLPIILVGIGHDRPWRLKTWDRFCLPRPFSRAIVLAAEPIRIPEDAKKEQLEEYRLRLETMLSDLTDFAEQLASAS